MPACASISKISTLIVILSSASAWAQYPTAMDATPVQPTPDRAAVPEEDDFTSTPYTEYGEFDDEADEAEQTHFFMHGRFFGVSLGSGVSGVSGNRGALYEGGFPNLEMKVHYWFDFNVALQFGFNQSVFFYTDPTRGQTDVNIFNFGIDIKYYFNTTNVSAAISFANPYILLGFGSYSKRELNVSQATNDTADTQVAPTIGGGLEFALQQKKLYLATEGKFHFPRFNDTNTTRFQNTTTGLDDLSGAFWSLNMSLVFTW